MCLNTICLFICFYAWHSPATTRAKRVKTGLTWITLLPCHARSTHTSSLCITLQTNWTWNGAADRVCKEGKQRKVRYTRKKEDFFFLKASESIKEISKADEAAQYRFNDFFFRTGITEYSTYYWIPVAAYLTLHPHHSWSVESEEDGALWTWQNSLL